LRREEVAALCGISTTWYTWIEQERTTAVSAHTLGELARGLGLSTAERGYLFQLAGRADPQGAAVAEADLASYAMLVRSVRCPAYVLDRHWNAVAWNPPAAELFADWLGAPTAVRARRARQAAPEPAPPNLLRYVFLHPRAPRLIVGWPERARRVVAEYRADSAAWSDDPAHARLVDELCAASPAFEAAWRSQQVLAREGGERRFRHPVKGEVSYAQFTMRMAQPGDVKLIVLHPCKDTIARAP
jgi:transcriptional regulator with XRE-family HTH domain